MFSDFSIAEAIRLMEKLSSKPSAKLFLYPMLASGSNTPKSVAFSNYQNLTPDVRKLVKKNASITTVFNNLLNQKYKYFDEWRRDVFQIHENALLLFGEGSYQSQLSLQLITHFEKEYRAFAQYDMRAWCKEYARLAQRYTELVQQMDGKIANNVAIKAPPKVVSKKPEIKINKNTSNKNNFDKNSAQPKPRVQKHHDIEKKNPPPQVAPIFGSSNPLNDSDISPPEIFRASKINTKVQGQTNKANMPSKVISNNVETYPQTIPKFNQQVNSIHNKNNNFNHNSRNNSNNNNIINNIPVVPNGVIQNPVYNVPEPEKPKENFDDDYIDISGLFD